MSDKTGRRLFKDWASGCESTIGFLDHLSRGDEGRLEEVSNSLIAECLAEGKPIHVLVLDIIEARKQAGHKLMEEIQDLGDYQVAAYALMLMVKKVKSPKHAIQLFTSGSLRPVRSRPKKEDCFYAHIFYDLETRTPINQFGNVCTGNPGRPNEYMFGIFDDKSYAGRWAYSDSGVLHIEQHTDIPPRRGYCAQFRDLNGTLQPFNAVGIRSDYAKRITSELCLDVCQRVDLDLMMPRLVFTNVSERDLFRHLLH